MKYHRLVSSAKSVKISWLRYSASKAHVPLSSLAVTASPWDGSNSHVESGLWKSFFYHEIPLFFGSTIFFAVVDGSGELASLHTVMLPMGESLFTSEEDGSYSWFIFVVLRTIRHHQKQKHRCRNHLGQQQLHHGR